MCGLDLMMKDSSIHTEAAGGQEKKEKEEEEEEESKGHVLLSVGGRIPLRCLYNTSHCIWSSYKVPLPYLLLQGEGLCLLFLKL